MEVDNCLELDLCSPRDFVKPMSLAMDDHGSPSHPRSSGLRVSPKSKAPSPPGLKKLDSPGFSQWYPGNPHLTMDQKENLIDKELSLTVVLPGGVEKTTVVHGSKPLMDLLVTLCAKYHLNPSSHTLELVTSNRNSIKLKPNALIGTLDAEKILLKPKGEDKNKKAGPQMPEATVRMVINYKKTQKTILRVNPRVPLAELLPAICEKCEFDTESTVLLRDVQSLAPLDLSSSLNDYAIREVYARDTRGQPASPPPVCPASPTYAGTVPPGKDKDQKEKENKGLFRMFRRSKKKSEQPTTASAPASPVLVSKPRPLSMALPSTNSSPLGSPTSPTDAPKKRRAPQPPILVSQSSFPSDLSPRQRLYSEPSTRMDRDQMTGLCRGASAESSLKRTKRKAPPPPTSPSAVVQESASLEENLEVGAAAANTLEEIMEQEEATASTLSATAGKTQREEEVSVDVSADVSVAPPSSDVEIQRVVSVEGSGEDQSCDLSSDGNQLQSSVNESATLSDTKADSSEPLDTSPGPGPGPGPEENMSPQSTCEESTMTDGTEGDCSAALTALPPPVKQDAEASVQTNTETLEEQMDVSDGPAITSTLRPAGEDAEVQTDFSQLPEPPRQQPTDEAPASAPESEPAGKKDMATLTEQQDPADLEPLTSATSFCQDSTPSTPATAKPPSLYAADSEPKPKPSNELTRDYIPKVGMTTYTIVPQKSLEKLRYFEVALTLEAPPEPPEDGPDVGSLCLDEGTGQGGQQETEVSTLPRDNSLGSTTPPSQRTVNGSIPESAHPSPAAGLHNTHDKISPSADAASPAGSPVEVKEIKIPPATRPKPGSFRLPQHKKIPGYYVTSAAEKSLGSSPGSSSSLREAHGSAERAKLPPPPLPPPVQSQETPEGGANVQLSPRQDETDAAFMRVTRQSSLPSREPSTGLSLEKLRSFAAPRPYSPSTPSRFAQAVSSAVQRSRSLSQGPKSPPLSPVKSPSSVVESKGFSNLKDCEQTEVDGDGSTLQGDEGEPPSYSEIIEMGRESSP